MVKYIIANGGDVNIPMQAVYQNSTPLITASEYGNCNCITASEYWWILAIENSKSIHIFFFIWTLTVQYQ